MADFKYDVFISYSHQNQDWVKNTLLPRLVSGAKRIKCLQPMG